MFKKTILVLLLAVGSLKAATEPLGVLYYPSLDNLTSPNGLRAGVFYVLTNLSVPYITTNRVVLADTTGKLVPSALTTNQAHALSQIVGTNNLIFLGTPSLSSGSGAPTNGVEGIANGSLYFRTGGASINESLYVSLATNWYSLATTNAGSITESQLNFSDVTTADTSTNEHGLAPKLSGIGTEFLSGLGLWTEVPSANGALNNNDIPFYFGAEFFPSGLDYDAASQSITASTNFTINGILNAKGTNTANILTVTNWGGTTIGDVSVSAHGLVPTAPNDSAKFLNGLGTWSVPPGSGGGVATTGSPAANQITSFSGTNTITGDSSATLSAGIITATGFIPSGTQQGKVYGGSAAPNVSISTPGEATDPGSQALLHYQRINDVVYVTGHIVLTRTGSGRIIFTVDLPVASANTTARGSGEISNAVTFFPIGPCIVSGGLSGKAVITAYAASTSGASGTRRDFHFTFSYVVL